HGFTLQLRPIGFQIPAPRLLGDIAGDLLGFQIVIEAPLTEFATDSAAFVAAPGGLGERWLRAVDPDYSRAQTSGHALTTRLVLGHDRRGKSEARVVRQRDGFFLVIEGAQAHYRPENLFVPYPAVGGNVGQNGWLKKIAVCQMSGPPAARDQAGSLLLPAPDCRDHVVVLRLADQRAQ